MARASSYLAGAAVVIGLTLSADAAVAWAGPAPHSVSLVSTTQCTAPPAPGTPMYGTGTPASADAAYSALGATVGAAVPGTSQLAFTGADTTKVAFAGVGLIAMGGVIVLRSRRQADGASDLAGSTE